MDRLLGMSTIPKLRRWCDIENVYPFIYGSAGNEDSVDEGQRQISSGRHFWRAGIGCLKDFGMMTFCP